MRIGQIAAAYQQQVRLRVQAATPGSADRAATSNPQVAGQDRAARVNQARLDDATRGLGRAVALHDGLTTVASGLSAAQAAIAQAQAPNGAAPDRAGLQRTFAAALAAIDEGATAQRDAMNDPALLSSAFDAARIPVLSADRLGSRRGQGFATVAQLARLDLSTATSDQLAQAARVLDAARSQTDAQRAIIGTQASRISTRISRMQAVQDLVRGTGQGPSAQGGLMPGSLLDLRG